MTRRIKSFDELPSWFKEREYEKNINRVDWYREIRRRQHIETLFEMRFGIKKFTEAARDEMNSILLEMLEFSPRSDSVIYALSQTDRPVQDLTAGEALYLRSAIKDKHLIRAGERVEKLLAHWRASVIENPAPSFKVPYHYERRIAAFMSDIKNSDLAEKFDAPIEVFLGDMGNPWLSYGKPLNGCPVTIDTQYDDKTLIDAFKGWLAKRRAADGERRRRPFNQKDFDDWGYFKIREIFDLETWAKLSDVKIPDNVLANALWPISSDDFSPIDVLRTTARKKTKEIFSFDVVVRLYGQLLIEEGENFLMK